MIRFLAILSLVAIVLFALAACAEEANPTPAPAATAAPLLTPDTPVTRPPESASSDPLTMSPEGLSAEEIAGLVTEAVKERTADGVSAEEMQATIEEALSAVPEGVTQIAIQAAIAMALENSSEDVAMASELAAEEAAMASALVVEEERANQATATPQPMTIPAPAHAAQATPTPAPTAAPAPVYTPPATPAPRAQGTPSATTFQDYIRERFVSSAIDNVSTFSLDTDRTSYYLALNWARQGYAVDPDSVRAEEWINAFNYNYDPPLRDDSFAITSDLFRHPLDDRMHMARITFQAPEANYDATPVNVTLVLDASGSMNQGDRVSIAREAADAIRISLRSQDRIAVVQFSSEVLHQHTVQHSSPDDPDVSRSINRLTGTNATNVQAGLDLGVQLADQARRANPGAYNYIILMSDGVANVDATDPFAILESAGDYDSSNPLRLITIGVGIENYNDYLLEQLAQHGNGWYRYLSDVNQARATFTRDNWLALSIPFADQTRAQVTWDPTVVQSWRIVGYENRITSDESFTQARREFAEIPAGAATTVFYELELTRDGLARNARLGEVEIRWVTPSSGESNRQHSTISGQGDVRFGAMNNPLLQLGALIALSSDRYSSLPFADASAPSVHRDLLYLTDELRALDSQLGNLDAYHDVAFLMEHITRDSREFTTPSGYSP